MPSSMTHTYFGIDVYKNLPTKYQKKISSNLELFKLFSQGSDPFMFYNFLIGKKAKLMKNIQEQMHQEKTRNFFLNTIKYIHQNNLQTSSTAMSYLYGHICHYYLDLHTHPYIFYKSGIFDVKDKNTHQYNGLHQQIEYAIDIYYINQNETTHPHQFKIHKNLFKTPYFTKELNDLINNSIGTTYKIKDSHKKYLKSVKHMKAFNYIANYDPQGLKLKLYKLLDKITSPQIIKIQELSFKNTYPNINNYLNINHQKWNYPWDKTKTSTKSFLDLYELAKKDTLNTIQKVTDLLEEKVLNTKKLEQIFKDLSYLTGKPCQEKLKMKYFEF